MKYYSQNQTELLNGLKDTLYQLNKDNRWVRLADSLPWAEIEQQYNKCLHNQRGGAGNKPARRVVGALIVKHTMNLSDEETIQMIQENPYMQYLVGLTEYQTTPIFSSELLTIARKRLGEDFFNEVTLMINRKEVDKKGVQVADGYIDNDGEKHSGVMKIDATCTDAEMKYPTDIGLLEDGSREIDRLLSKICDRLGMCKPKTNRGQSHSVFVNYTKRKHKGKELRRQTRQYQIHYLKSDIDRLMTVLSKVLTDRLMSVIKSKELRNLEAILNMLAQQEEMLSLGVRSCANRIVSIFQPHVRPIIRGKAKAKVEFGAKVGISVVNGYDYIDTISWDAYNESIDLEKQLELYRKRFGFYPAEIQADKIYLNKENRALLKKKYITCHCAPLGRPPKNPDPTQVTLRAKASGERNAVEAAFGTAKRRYRADNIRAKLPNTAQSWIATCFFVKNLKKFLQEILFALFGFLPRFMDESGVSDSRRNIMPIYCTLIRL